MAEVTPTSLRAGSVSMVQVLIVLGVLIGFAVSKPFVTASTPSWAGAFACATPLAGLLLVLLPLTPESPRWLMSKGRGAEAVAILRRLRGLPAAEGTGEPSREAAVAAELAMISASLTDVVPATSESVSVPKTGTDVEDPAALAASTKGADASASSSIAPRTRASAFRSLTARLLQPHIMLAMGTGFTLGQFQQMSGMVSSRRGWMCRPSPFSGRLIDLHADPAL